MRDKIKIAIVEDNYEILTSLKNLINQNEDMVCKHTYRDGEEAIAFFSNPAINIDIAVVDIGLPGRVTGIDCVRAVKEKRIDILCMMYTVFDRADQIFSSLKAGANSYILKSSSNEAVIQNIRELQNGGAPMTPGIARKVTDYFHKGKFFSQEYQKLTNREKDILDLLEKGYLYKEIAGQLGISVGTVKQNIHRIYQKLHVNNRTEAIRKINGES